MAREVGLTQTAVHRIWRAFGLQPHRQETWKLSTDPQFIDKVKDVVGIYLDPPERAVVLCVDEKSQIQALDRSAPILPMLPGTPQRATHDYKRSGTSSLYAALDLTTGEVIGAVHSRHRAIEFKKFLQTIGKFPPTSPSGPRCAVAEDGRALNREVNDSGCSLIDGFLARAHQQQRDDRGDRERRPGDQPDGPDHVRAVVDRQRDAVDAA